MKKANKNELATKIMAYGATAASLLVVAQPAAAAIVYSGAKNIAVNAANTPVNLDLNNDGTDDFRFINSISTVAGNMTNWWQDIYGLGGAQFIFATTDVNGNNSDPLNLPAGYNIKSALSGTHSWGSDYNTMAGSGSTSGNFNLKSGYVGVRFHSAACQGSNWNYGWIHFANTGNMSTTMSSTIDGWAYESSCDTAINAGAGVTAPARLNVPTLDQWGMLLMAGLLSGAALYRVRKDQKKA